jgi:hypothetical protein
MKKKAFPSRRLKLPAKLLLVDDRYQRDLVRARVDHLADAMDLDGLGVFHVSRRTDGRYFIIDAQHRHAALAKLDLLDWEVD